MRGDLEATFPRLAQGGYEITSPQDHSYNCIAWAAEETTRWWWPSDQSYWPPGVSRRPAVEAFVEAFRRLGYERCDDPSLEPGWEKIALYAKEGSRPTHAARQLPDGTWTSKLGKDVDIKHGNLEALRSDIYGEPVVIMRRRRVPSTASGGGSPS
jgi:hypothetical protein